mmetsp:Transcript_92428/g.264064  ORF Transcript_92428/g.264064 Transcript_92428/m.264064 type:complete len:227 (+) Transcript_92428:780-1460(+)
MRGLARRVLSAELVVALLEQEHVHVDHLVEKPAGRAEALRVFAEHHNLRATRPGIRRDDPLIGRGIPRLMDPRHLSRVGDAREHAGIGIVVAFILVRHHDVRLQLRQAVLPDLDLLLRVRHRALRHLAHGQPQPLGILFLVRLLQMVVERLSRLLPLGLPPRFLRQARLLLLPQPLRLTRRLLRLTRSRSASRAASSASRAACFAFSSASLRATCSSTSPCNISRG